MRFATWRSASPCGGDVETDDVGAVAGEHLGDRLADAARGARDDGDLAGERVLGVGDGLGLAGADAHDLRRDEGRLGAEEEAQGGLEVALRAGRDVDELGGPAEARLLRGGADEALQRALGDRGGRAVGLLRRGAEDEDPAAGRELGDVRVKERVQGVQGARGVDPGGVEDERGVAVLLVGAGDLPAHARVLAGGGGVDVQLARRQLQEVRDGPGEAAAGGGADQRRAVEQGLSGLVAAQVGRVREPELLDEELAGRRARELLVAVAHGGKR